jgi:hypothetical protein
VQHRLEIEVAVSGTRWMPLGISPLSNSRIKFPSRGEFRQRRVYTPNEHLAQGQGGKCTKCSSSFESYPIKDRLFDEALFSVVLPSSSNLRKRCQDVNGALCYRII